MSDHGIESKRLLSYVIAEWACSLTYEHLSPEAIQAAKLSWSDSIGCALGGSQRDDAKILLAHYRAVDGDNGAAAAFAGPVFVTTGHGDVLAQLRAATEPNILNLRSR
jgi:2-methylcitrate dehydratase PrpD